jgi:hypothetical protein
MRYRVRKKKQSRYHQQAIFLRASVLVGNDLSLRGNTALLSMTVSALLTAVKEIGIILSNLRRIFGANLIDSFLKISLLCEIRLLGRVQRASLASLGCGATLIGSSETLSFGGNTVLGRLGLASRASLARLEIVGIISGDGLGILLHLAEDILCGAFKVLQGIDQRVAV